MENKKILVILAEGFEEIEAVSPIDILRRAGIDVVIAGLSGTQVTGAHGVRVNTDLTLDGINEEFDAVLLPGGSPGAANLSKSERVKNIIKDMYKKGKIIAAICASPVLVLAPTGILKGRTATCYAGMEKEFPPDVKFRDEKVVVDGNIVTSKGPGTAALFALKLVELLKGKDKEESLKSKMIMGG